MNAAGHRWVGELPFHNQIQAGKTNTDADTLSWFSVKLQNPIREYSETLHPGVLSAIWQGEEEVQWVTALQLCSSNDNLLSASTLVFSPEDIRAAEEGDASIYEIMTLKKRG